MSSADTDKASDNIDTQEEVEDNTHPLERALKKVELNAKNLDFAESSQAQNPQEGLGQGEGAEIQKPDDDLASTPTVEALSEEQAVHVESAAEDESDAVEMELAPSEGQEELEFIEQSQALSIIESLLFSSDRPLTLTTFKTVFQGTDFSTKQIKKALEELQSVYADPARGVSLEEVNGGWQLRTKVDNMDFLKKLAKARPFKLSGPALEVLAIIAYKQPLVKSEVDEIRGVESGHLVRALMEKGLVNFQGKSELPGKPMQYGTTRKFLEIFGLRNLRELPSLDEIDQLLPDGIGMEEEDEKLSDVTDKMSENYDGNYSEGEEELLKIEETLGDIDTSSEFFEEEKRRQKEKRDRDRARDIREAIDVGEAVDAKDLKWLQRYDEQLAAAQAEEQPDASADETSPVEELVDTVAAEDNTDS